MGANACHDLCEIFLHLEQKIAKLVTEHVSESRDFLDITHLSLTQINFKVFM